MDSPISYARIRVTLGSLQAIVASSTWQLIVLRSGRFVAQPLMKHTLLPWLACPTCHAALKEETRVERDGEIEEGSLLCGGCGAVFPITEGIPRFVASDEYASSFGHQWNRYAELQLDSRNGTRFSEERFRSITEWTREDLCGKLVLDVGCGSGRFAEIALADGAEVIALDLSRAVDACRRNLRAHPKLHVIQASIYDLPFRDGLFDVVYSIGVIQHTPDPHQAVQRIAAKVALNGRIGLWIYELSWKALVGTVGFKYLLRPMTRRCSISTIERWAAFLERLCRPITRWGRRHGLLGKIAMRMLPVSCAHLQSIPLSETDFQEWVRLDTFDMYSPAHDHPQTFRRVRGWLVDAGFRPDPRHPHGGISITATRLGERAVENP
ncbi:MAG: methyltransferase domain-containing protein [Verrucomicrobiae bacterium]|nr:methyltransferase domain-containing protein [Verrucomicrobiae bacterium]